MVEAYHLKKWHFTVLLNEKSLTVTDIARKLKIMRSCVYKYTNRGIFNAENRTKTKVAD